LLIQSVFRYVFINAPGRIGRPRGGEALRHRTPATNRFESSARMAPPAQIERA
jgi:hypothetical protein